ncbi:N-formylglutamate amidohydrolase [Nitrospirillum viridazoti Y2]|uniref:Formiminoglutamase n=1 Tax=Nitrospirillum amazonense TaxID=28077 RepID=A0A560HM91_9PROT|nr:N-formylglutamate deformylase [Nitrospirillum amazonense]EGY00345.1 N-formylglutamate amidohydrolase [Nitrospirillum amazonense Y2]TWB47653.1 formiminoglutamase [Nitrospirillum amazonense]
MTDWLEIHRGAAPLVVTFPHTGTDIPDGLLGRFASPWLARKDADWWIDRLYAFAADMGATTIRTRLSRSVIDVNRDPSGASLYPGQATTDLCPVTTFDGEPLYAGVPPDAADIAARRTAYFDPYHDAIRAELARLRRNHGAVVLYDAHSIRSVIPRLFDGPLPQFNIGTNGGVTCDGALATAIHDRCAASGHSYVLNGRFKGGWTTRHYGRPADGVHAIQMELAIRGYLAEPGEPGPDTWPPPFDPAYARPLVTVLTGILDDCLAFATSLGRTL